VHTIPESPCRQSAVTRLAALPGGRLLASADEDGHLVATDVRTLGGGPTGEHPNPTTVLGT
jgi:hypothetical protein